MPEGPHGLLSYDDRMSLSLFRPRLFRMNRPFEVIPIATARSGRNTLRLAELPRAWRGLR